MRKTLLFFVALVLAMTGAKAQSALVATLTQNGTVLQYYGATALQEAYEAAEDGAVINLSSGTFYAVNIEKIITLRGAGCLTDKVTSIDPTYIANELTITLPTGSVNYLHVEGINFLNSVTINGVNQHLDEAYFYKCSFTSGVTCGTCHPHFLQSFFKNGLVCGIAGYPMKVTRITCDNCYVYRLSEQTRINYCDSKFFLNNCTLIYPGTTYSIYHNCIIVDLYNNAISGDNTVNNCVGTSSAKSPKPNMFANFPNNSNVYVEDITQLFKTFVWTGSTNDLKENELYELTETAAATYLGDDGTQVGIYGGSYPFSIAPSNPQVKKFIVSNTTDGDKLKVKINVE